MRAIEEYELIIFDCDGVIFNSNKIKSDAFYAVALKYGKDNASQLLNFHQKNGGMSRHYKFKYFVDKIAGLSLEDYDQLLLDYGQYLSASLNELIPAPGLLDFRKKTQNSKWMVLSGALQSELRILFQKKDIDHLFDYGIYGSPLSKIQLLAELQIRKKITKPVIFIGDSKYDYQVAMEHGFDFIFLSEWTELENWKNFCKINKLTVRKNVNEILSHPI